VRRKAVAALRYGLTPLICVGETLSEREAGSTFEVVERQLRCALTEGPATFALAYEPVWAIGTGETATPEIAQEAHAFLRRLLTDMLGETAAEAKRILYGGSVSPQNATELISQPDLDGFLVGGASLADLSREETLVIYVVYAIHVLICLFLILVVLLQQGKGADLSVFGGGSTQAAFGARGAATILHKMTVAGFIGFILTTMSIGFLQTGSSQSSVMSTVEETAVPAAEPAAENAPAAEDPVESTAAEAVTGEPVAAEQDDAAPQESAPPPDEQ
jgi:protein translocase SecG subunit